MDISTVLLAPIVSEKSEALKESRKGAKRYSFYVHRKANKELVRQALRYLYKVKAVKVNIWNMPGKLKRFRRDMYRQSGMKKAVVTLARGQSIDLSAKEK